MAVDLLFKRPPLTGHPVNLVFGEQDGPPPVSDAIVLLVAELPALQANVPVALGVTTALAGGLPALTGSFTVTYNTDTARPLVSGVTTHWQDGTDHRAPVESSLQQAVPLPAAADSNYQRALPLAAGVRAVWQEAVRLRRGAEVHFEEAIRLGTQAVGNRFQQGIPVHLSRGGRYQEALRVPTHAVRNHFQEAYRDRRNWAAGRFQQGVPLSLRVETTESDALPFFLSRDSRYQEAMRPPPGIWVRPGPQPEDPCYVPPDGDKVHLLFQQAWSSDTNLLFICERHGPGPQPGDTVVVPVKEVYLVVNSAVLIRVDGGILIPTTSMSMSLDVDSWTWSFSASVPGVALPNIEPVDGVPVGVQATVNGVAYRFIVESISRERAFNQNALRIGGRGRAAVLDAPYAPIRDYMNTGARTAQQLLADILTDNGVPLGWDVEWNPTDWLVPAGAFSHQGSHISAMNAVVGAAGAYLQPHNTAEAMRVLSRYPVAPWNWGSVSPDFEIPSAVATREGIEWAEKPRYNRVFVSGQQVGVLGQVTRAGTAGDMLAPTVVDPLITHVDAARQRGTAILSDTGRIASVTLRMPVLEETGIIPPGKFVRYVDNGVERIGLTRSVQVEVGLPSIWQSIGVETHVL